MTEVKVTGGVESTQRGQKDQMSSGLERSPGSLPGPESTELCNLRPVASSFWVSASLFVNEKVKLRTLLVLRVKAKNPTWIS